MKRFLIELFVTIGAVSVIGTIVDMAINGFEFNMFHQIVIIAIIQVFFRYLFFSEEVIKNKGYSFRNMGFNLTFLPSLLILGVIWEWFPVKTEAIIGFFIIYLIIAIILNLMFIKHYKKIGFEYSTKLNEFKKQHNK